MFFYLQRTTLFFGMAKVRENFNQQNFSVFFLAEFSTPVNKHYLEDFIQAWKPCQLRFSGGRS